MMHEIAPLTLTLTFPTNGSDESQTKQYIALQHDCNTSVTL